MPSKIKRITEYLAKLPGIGPRQANRLALNLTQWGKNDLESLAELLIDLKNGPLFCEQCFNFSENELCNICSNHKRNRNRIAVVEKIADLESLEKSGFFDGTYFVLGSAIIPTNNLEGKIRIEKLVTRVAEQSKNNNKVEIVLATNPNAYGETTALYIKEKLTPFNIKITHLAKGLSFGSLIENADEATIIHALKNRK